ncbi:MAG: MAPEG family protein [Roseitalea sp.]|nr:MAPEG family protein [Roseitalea sp.]MBO6952236.1 MAPEG family protein [Rhizobiaceae bacterium]MBO6591918.1 MAPEG family protein [Roseitalea sp.]MBO6598173.1 MAPEG family protein [Roseitalea sp.]MBO6610619.1 MAPEG family protein [Roseitalea sp.]
MTFWILMALGLYFVQTLLPVAFRFKGSPEAMKSRDEMPEASVVCGRADRALANVTEAMILFIPLALLLQAAGGAALGAIIFVCARIIYVPLYLTGVPYLRTFAWIASLGGLLVMAMAITG